MTRVKIMILFQCLLLGLSRMAPSYASDSTYTNPIGGISNIGDPFVMKFGGKYYMYATSVWYRGFLVWESENLVDWTEKGLAFDSQWEGNGWGTTDFWAPEVIRYQDRFIMSYSARAADGKLKIALAQSDDPIGPFINFRAPLLDSALTCIDSDIFVDDNGTPYIYFARDCSDNIVDGKHTSQVWVQALSADSLKPVGEPVFCTQPDQPWEHPQDEWRWNEGPFVLKHAGLYYLLYSANFYASPDYAVGYAMADHPFGPWTKYAGNPVLSKKPEISVSGPGHCCVTTSPDGTELFIVYHTHTHPDAPSGDRQPNIDRMYFEDGAIRIIGPTRSPQPMPSANATRVGRKSLKQPRDFTLLQNYPNPLNQSTTIEFSLSREAKIHLTIVDAKGRVVRSLFSLELARGIYSIRWDGTTDSGEFVGSGCYFCQLTSDGERRTVKILLLK